MKYVATILTLAIIFIGEWNILVIAPACAIITPAPVYTSINIRTTKSTADDTNIAGQLQAGETVHVATIEGLWYQLDDGNYIKSTVAVCAMEATPTRIPSSTPGSTSSPTAASAPTEPAEVPTPTMFTVCIQDICSLFSSPIVVTIDEYRP